MLNCRLGIVGYIKEKKGTIKSNKQAFYLMRLFIDIFDFYP